MGIIILLAVAGIATYEWLLPILAEYLVKQEGSETTLTIIETILTLVFLSFIPIMFYVFAVYRKKISREQYQPPGTKVNRATQQLKSQQEIMKSQMMVFIAVVMIILALVGWIVLRFAVESLSGK